MEPQNINDIAVELKIIQKETIERNKSKIGQVVDCITECYKKQGKVLICGNGGSAGDSQHFAAELVSRFLMERPALAAISLATDTSIMTAIGNDYTFDNIFMRQVEALGKEGDILIGISTSGNSQNVVEAFKKAKEKNMICISLTGMDGGKLAPMSDYNLAVFTNKTPRVQEMHIVLIHIICEYVEYLCNKRG